MPPRRYTTVYDVAGLRVHTDGTRVDQTEGNLRLQKRRATTRDANGNWIALDAGGSVNVKKTTSQKNSSPSQAVVDTEDVIQEELPSTTAQRRRHKRQKFVHDYSFLEHQRSEPSSSSQAKTLREPPSSDLLKCIHHVASAYYTEQGLLLNASKEYRARRREERDQMKGDEDSDSGSEEDDDNDSAKQRAEMDDDDEEEEEGKPKRKHRRKFEPVDRNEGQRRDMYRIMDGSALVAIGVLLQEHVARLLEPYIPEGWVDREDEDVDAVERSLVEEYGTDSDANSPQVASDSDSDSNGDSEQ